MNDQSQKSSRPTSPTSAKSTCSPASAGGRSHSDSPAGRTTNQSGPGAAPASPSALPGLGPEQMTLGTCGQSSTDSSGSVGLQRSLESRLLRRLDVHGSPEYALTWKRQAMPSGQPICRLRASARRTSGNGSGGWHTPTVADAKGRTYSYDGHDKTKPRLSNEGLIKGYPTPRASDGDGGPDVATRQNGKNLKYVAQQTAGWPTPNAPNGGRRVKLDHMQGGTAISPKTGAKMQLGLETVAGWVTPAARDWKDHSTGNPDRATDRKARLEDQVHGTTTSGSPASTEPTGALNPVFTRWLMGYPPAWDDCAATATRSRRRSPPSS